MKGAEQLRGARTKLQRAEEHLGQLRREHDTFVDERNPYRMLREADPEHGYFIWRAKIVEPPPLEKWASIAGECVHALRSALDHTAFELVRIKRPTGTYSEFPIFKSGGEKGWHGKGPGKLPDVHRKVLAQVKWLQPYRRAKEYDPLWQVHALDIIDKHRHLNLVSPLMRSARFIATRGRTDDVTILAGPFEDGTAVARFRMIPDANQQMHMKTEFAFDIAFGEGEVLTNEPVMETLESLLVNVGGIVARFDRFFS